MAAPTRIGHDIAITALGHGYQLTVRLGPFPLEPTDRQKVNAREWAEQFFYEFTQRPVTETRIAVEERR